MKMATGASVLPDASSAIAEAWADMMASIACDPLFVICNASAEYPADQIQTTLKNLAPEACKIVGSSSCLGAMNNKGFHSQDGYGLSLLAFADDPGSFGIGLCEQGDNPFKAASEAVLEAISDAGRPGELPDLVWLTAAPGHEEVILDGIASVIGPDVPVMGGSSADNAIEGKWWQFSQERVEHHGVLVIVMYPECHVDFSFHNGYAPSTYNGVVTKAEGRTLYTIDDQPAAEVYNQWTDGLIDQYLSGGNILEATTFYPLGQEAGQIEHIPYYALLHPEQVLDDGAMLLFANAKIGERVTLMNGSSESLIARAGTVASGLIAREGWNTDQLAGALVVYCGGCMFGVRDKMSEVGTGINEALDGAPFQGLFSFGEQGCFMDGTNHHANLMISVLVFVNRSQ